MFENIFKSKAAGARHGPEAPPGSPVEDDAVVGDALMASGLRMQFYRDGFRRMLTSFVVVLLILLVSVLLNVWQFARALGVQREYFAVSPTGQLTPIVPLNAPFLTNQQLLAWSSESILRAYTMNAVNYRQAINSSRENFTPYGFKEYQMAIERSGIINTLLANTLIMTSTSLAVPVVTQEGVRSDGVYTWKVRMPVQITYRTDKKASTANQVVTVTIERVPTHISPYGVGISQFITTPLSE